MTNRYFIFLSYNGTSYHGWQIQENGITVQSILNKAISQVLRTEIETIGAGRTDTGVHAAKFVAHFDFVKQLSQEELIDLQYKLNSNLPNDIAISKIIQVKEDTHARFSALSRTYKYYISPVKNPFKFGSSYFFKGDLDINLMNDAAKILFEYTDFTSFSKLHTQTKTNNCKIFEAKWEEDLCNGCGSCIVGCHEGALQLIDNKARLISELFCDGLGACIGECPEGAIELEEREAEPYSEVETLKRIILTGDNTVVAHLSHLKEHGEDGYLNEALNYLKENNISTNFINKKTMETKESQCGCPGSAMQDLRNLETQDENVNSGNVPSQLRQWPIQMHLISPNAPYFKNADVLIAADCVAFALGNTHAELMKGKSIGIACPKLDSDMEVYVEKITAMIDDAKINTLTVAIMEVPCCGGLLRVAQSAVEKAIRKVPIKAITVGINGSILEENWV